MPCSAAATKIAISVGSPVPSRSLASSSASLQAAAASSKRFGSGPHSSRTTILPTVSVPVLSVQIVVAEPSVSTAVRRRTSTCFAAMRRTPSASATVTSTASPSGTAATASEIAESSTSRHGSPRITPRIPTSTTTPIPTAR